MKKIIYSIATIAAAAIAFASCQKENSAIGEPKTVTITVGKPDVAPEFKTELSGTKVLWNAGDAIGISDGKSTTNDKFTNDSAESSETTTFSGSTSLTGNVVAYYPYSSQGVSKDNGAKVDIPANQTSTLTSFDPKADLLVSKPFELTAEGEQASEVEFRRLTAILKVVLNTNAPSLSGELVNQVSLTSSATDIVGRVYVDFNEFTMSDIYYGAGKTVTIGADTPFEIDGTNAVYASVYPGTFASGTKLTVSGRTDNYTFAREITLGSDVVFDCGKVTTLNIAISEDDVDVPEDYSGEWMLTTVNNDVNYAMLPYVDGNNVKALVYTLNEQGKAVADGIDNCKYVIEKVTGEGDYKGMYTIQDVNGLYLYAAASGSNYMKAKEELTVDSYWDITCKDGVYSIVATKSGNRNVMQFNYNSGKPIFSCYASAGMKAVALFPWANVYIDTTPVINVSATEVGVTAAGALKNDVTVTGNKYLTGDITATVTEGSSWLTAASVSEGKLVITASENTTAQTRTATIEFTAEGAEAVALTLTQDAAGSTAIELTFDLTKNPGGWPTTNSTTTTNYTYKLNDVDYTFALKNVKCNTGYLMLTQPAALGLPAIEGQTLTKVVAFNSSGCSTSVYVGISSTDGGAKYVNGGDAQKWATQSSSYTYNLSGLSANTMYYIYVTSKNAQITKIVLSYQ